MIPCSLFSYHIRQYIVINDHGKHFQQLFHAQPGSGNGSCNLPSLRRNVRCASNLVVRSEDAPCYPRQGEGWDGRNDRCVIQFSRPVLPKLPADKHKSRLGRIGRAMVGAEQDADTADRGLETRISLDRHLQPSVQQPAKGLQSVGTQIDLFRSRLTHLLAIRPQTQFSIWMQSFAPDDACNTTGYFARSSTRPVWTQ
jgi:hypothetical protein